MGATGLGRTGFAHIAGLHKGEESQAATGGEEGSLESAPGVVAGGRGQQAQAGSWGGGGQCHAQWGLRQSGGSMFA